jgi:hypothetical protein
LLLATIVFLFVGSPILGYLLYPEGFAPTSVEIVNSALLYVVIGSAAAILGINWGSKQFKSVYVSKENAPRSQYFLSPRVFFALCLIISAIGFIYTLTYFGFSTLISEQTDRGNYAFLIRLINREVLIMIGLAIVSESWSTVSKTERKLLLLSIVMLLLESTLGGSRSALFNPLIFVFMIQTIKKGNFSLGHKRILIIIITLTISVIIYPIASGLREYWIRASRLKNYPDIYTFVQFAGEGYHGSNDLFLDMIYPVLARMNILDPIVSIMSSNREDANVYVNLSNELKSFVNIITPGDPFPKTIETSKVFLVVYKGYTLEHLDIYYTSCMYSLWGICYALFGSIGGIVAIFSIMFFVASAYQWLRRLKTRFSTYWQLLLLYCIYTLILSYGFSSTLSTAVYLLISSAWILPTLSRLSSSYRNYRSGKMLERLNVRPAGSFWYKM